MIFISFRFLSSYAISPGAMAIIWFQAIMLSSRRLLLCSARVSAHFAIEIIANGFATFHAITSRLQLIATYGRSVAPEAAAAAYAALQ